MAFNILIVDDSAVMRSVVKRIVTMAGLEVGEIYEADNGESALRVLKENWVDVVLSDINMPVMDGIELLKHIKESDDSGAAPVIMVSTEGRSGRIEEILALGAAGFITKPFKPEDIRSVMSKALGVDLDGRYAEEPEDSDF